MNKFSSELNEDIFLSNEDFTELKLSGASWKIYVPFERMSITITADYLLSLIYKHTNLLTIKGVEHNLITVMPKIQIEIFWLDGTYYGLLSVNHCYCFWTPEDK